MSQKLECFFGGLENILESSGGSDRALRLKLKDILCCIVEIGVTGPVGCVLPKVLSWFSRTVDVCMCVYVDCSTGEVVLQLPHNPAHHIEVLDHKWSNKINLLEHK